MKLVLRIGEKVVGEGNPTYVIADPAANHEGRYETMEKLLIAAANAGADAFKTQTYRPEDLTIDCDKDPFMLKGTLWDGRSLWKLYQEAQIPWEWNERLQKTALDLGIELFSTAYSLEALKYLLSIGVPAIKIASFEMNNDAFLEQASLTDVPLIVSTGMASMDEIVHAHKLLCEKEACFCLLHCISAYPARPCDLHLRRIGMMRKFFNEPIGFSDHSLDPATPALAVAMGATIIEKHIRLAGHKSLDSGFSLDEDGFEECVGLIRLAEEVRGDLMDDELEGHLPVSNELSQIRRSLFLVEDVKRGDRVSLHNVRAIRPAGGMPPKSLPDLFDMFFKEDYERGTPLIAEMLT